MPKVKSVHTCLLVSSPRVTRPVVKLLHLDRLAASVVVTRIAIAVRNERSQVGGGDAFHVRRVVGHFAHDHEIRELRR